MDRKASGSHGQQALHGTHSLGVRGILAFPGIHSPAFPGIPHLQQPGADPPLPPTTALARVAARSQDFSPRSG